MKKHFFILHGAFRSNVRSVTRNLLLAVPLRAGRLAAAASADGPKELWFSKTSRGCGLVTLALALAWVAHGANPVLIGQWPGKPRGAGQGFAMGVAVSGNYAYVADSHAGLHVIDVSNPAKPVRVGGYDASGYARGVAVSGNYAYVVGLDTGLEVIDVSNPAKPVRVGGYDASGQSLMAYDVAVSGNYAYVANSTPSIVDAGILQVFDVSNPANPQWVGACDTSGSAVDVAVSGNYAYVADQFRWIGSDIVGSFEVIDVSNPANPQWVSGYDTSGVAYGVEVSGNYAYVADGAAGLQVIDVGNPGNPQRVGGYNTSGYSEDVAVSGNYVYVADGEWGLIILGPRTPRITSVTLAASTATVYYTNTIAGTAYTLDYCTNLTTGTWQPVGTQPAPGNSASQTDSAAGGDQRYYRVSYRPQ